MFLIVAANLAIKIQRDALLHARSVRGSLPPCGIHVHTCLRRDTACVQEPVHVGHSGETEEILETGKLMSGRMQFAIMLEHQSGDAGSDVGRFSHVCSLAGSSEFDTSSKDPTVHIIHGTLATPLASLANQTGPVVTECIDTDFELPRECEGIVASTFPFRAQLRGADMHRSYPCAERAALALRDSRLATYRVASKHASTYFRCSMHRVRTAEKLVEDMDAEVESFFMNFALSLRETNHLQTLRRQVERWSANRRVLVWKRGTPPRGASMAQRN